HTHTHTHTHMHTQIHIHTHTHHHTHSCTQAQTDTHTHTHIVIDRPAHRLKQIHTHIHTHTHTHKISHLLQGCLLELEATCHSSDDAAISFSFIFSFLLFLTEGPILKTTIPAQLALLLLICDAGIQLSLI